MSTADTIDEFKYARLSKVEKQRLDRFRARNPVIDERDESRHPNRQDNSRRAMKNLVRWRNRKETGRYNGERRTESSNTSRTTTKP